MGKEVGCLQAFKLQETADLRNAGDASPQPCFRTPAYSDVVKQTVRAWLMDKRTVVCPFMCSRYVMLT